MTPTPRRALIRLLAERLVRDALGAEAAPTPGRAIIATPTAATPTDARRPLRPLQQRQPAPHLHR